MTPHRRPSRGGDTEPRAANEEAGREHGKRRPLIFPEHGGANGERADNQRIGQQKRVVARPERFPLRIDEVDIGLEHGELFGLRRRSLFLRGHCSNSSLAAGQPPEAVPARGKGARLAALAWKNPKDLIWRLGSRCNQGFIRRFGTRLAPRTLAIAAAPAVSGVSRNWWL